MTLHRVTFSVASLALLVSMHAQGQGLKPATKPLQSTTPVVQQSADFIVAVVNSEPITNNEVRRELQRAIQFASQQGRPQAASQALASQVLENLINQRVQLQQARDTGIRVDEAAIDLAEMNVAIQNKVDVNELHKRLAADGVTVSQMRGMLKDQLMLSRLRQRDVESRVQVSDLEVEAYLQEQPVNLDPETLQINLAQILIAVPENATPVQIAALQAKGQRALSRARGGEDFVALVKEFSDASDSGQGGQMGLRTAIRYPQLFLEATNNLAVGDVSALIRSGAGFHILKVVEKISPSMPTMAVTQSRARHILLRLNPQLTESQAREQLSEFKRAVVAGKADFAALAREHSQDGSAAQGGELGWASPGMFVPEFEEVMNRLEPGQVSDPLVSRFGVHLIQLMERRKAALSPREQRDTVRAMLSDKKMEPAFTSWAEGLRARAYVELREPPSNR
ncbi:peptidylprolyl isomerase [Rhodoferax sp. PAMC 29310]|uniref:peptidylprolyl isomerase n=1 Tax=Rhodoferax sp. PAMC 29310 TaxID=2822760 RepID=UPI001B33B93D|nr:peptidylprolyl isomerase [Rhodoferax sp. PAMC 29310]